MTNYRNRFSLEDRVYIVTGGTGHLGREACKAIASFGGIVYCFGRDNAKFSQFDEHLRDNPSHRITFVKADATKENQLQQAVDKIIADEGRLDGLFNNAASSRRGINPDIKMEDWADGFATVLSHYFLLARIVLREMEKCENGVIVNNASIWGTVVPDPRTYLNLKNEPPLFLPPAKAGILQLTRYLAVLYAPKHIRVNAISPGLFPQRRGPDRPDYMQELTKRVPMARIGNPEEIGGVVSFLFSDAASYITGQNIVVDGGYTLW